jgi:hypothetical protein
MTEAKQLPPKLEAVMLRLCSSAELNKTQAVKLPYLVDVVANHVLGRAITEGQHEAWQYGVVTSEAWRFLDVCDGDPGLFVLEPVPFSEEKRVLPASEEPVDTLSPEEQRIVDFVAEEFASIQAGQLGLVTKLMNPAITSWGANGKADLGEDAYERMSADYQEMASDVMYLGLDSLRRNSRRISGAEEALA